MATVYRENAQAPSANEHEAENVQSEDEQFGATQTVHFTPSRKDVLKASFLSFSFLGLVPVLAIGYRDLDRIIDVDEQLKGVLTFLTQSCLITLSALFLLITAAVAFGVMKTFLQYGKYEIASDDERIFIHSGMLNEKSFSIKKANVQAVQMTQSPLKKLLGFTEIKLISAGSD